MYCIYKITNKINNKVYIGQTSDPKYRWYQHQSYAKGRKPQQYIHHAISKYGSLNFTFEVIDFGLNVWHTDCLETNYIKIFDSRNPEKGYNLKTGGSRGIHSDITKKKISEATIKQIQEKGHPAQGTKRTPEQLAILSAALKARDHEKIYNEEVRQRMSEAHIGIKDSEETKRKKSEKAKLGWLKRKNKN